MKKKLITYFILCLTIITLISGILFYIIGNMQERNRTKDNLQKDNAMLIQLYKQKNLSIDELIELLSNVSIDLGRYTLISPEGVVAYDSESLAAEKVNHNDRIEVIEAREDGEGYSTRYSETLKENMMYYATKLDNGYILRTSMHMEGAFEIEKNYLKYYVIVLSLLSVVTIYISTSLANRLVMPIKELQMTASKISRGDLESRVKIYSQDEVGDLGRVFNIMTSKMEAAINKLTEEQNTLQAILESMESGVIAIDDEDRVILTNLYVEKIFGIKTNVLGEKIINLVRDIEIEKIIKANNNVPKEIEIRHPQPRSLRIKTAYIRKGYEIIGRVAVVQDITDIKKLENLRYQFMANVSHELKTPLTSIKGFAETLRYVKEDDKKEKFLNIINEEANRLTSLINDILTLSDIETHKDKLYEDIEVNAIIKDVFLLLKPIADEKEIQLTYDISDTTVIVSGEQNKFKQMLINLIDNAIKYSDRNGFVKVQCFLKEDYVVITVEDNGIGIENICLNRIFERFYRVDEARSRARGGTGLGLAIVKHIILEFKGTIDVESEIGKGTKFIVKVPKA
ncbi:HAMP domain-containing sensor histidine kinase [Clostridium cellulovorans]|uniref:histidine kinase n=1 Tax=Clostridium cellulovorans (strain ATCC 35296 / DSM 3052 / OCM 3 / 743B) TaxID=573061 RepID=D9SL81_CLOC7|nr:HAMP domain-containing sensor histidine kinase [Clostridium cellulovorans]ADL51597.1 multi-sensor signal transduction histidine kinase [Clostridium cellulovorans 743B]